MSNLHKTDPHWSVALSKSSIYAVRWGVSLQESANNETNPNSIFKSVRVRLRESVHLRECVSTEFDLGGKKQEMGNMSISRAVRLRECLLAESWL